MREECKNREKHLRKWTKWFPQNNRDQKINAGKGKIETKTEKWNSIWYSTHTHTERNRNDSKREREKERKKKERGSCAFHFTWPTFLLGAHTVVLAPPLLYTVNVTHGMHLLFSWNQNKRSIIINETKNDDNSGVWIQTRLFGVKIKEDS